ncbi:homoserine O- acetyltransferase [Irineochytrium annulatum]|nr:homoserine O- acetyltransferase [Irineochytrium annulatum]
MIPTIDQSIARLPTFEAECGEVLTDVPVAYKTWGKLNDSASNCMVICHALTGSADVEDWAFDTEAFFIFCGNVFGSPYGSLSPVSVNPKTGKTYGPDFPLLTIRDDVRAHKAVLDSLGVKQIKYVIGGSMGGMQPPKQGLAAARMAALLTYRSRNSFETRFGRKIAPSKPSSTPTNHPATNGTSSSAPTSSTSVEKKAAAEDIFSAQSYLRYQGEKFVNRFDANCYIAITRKMDTHDISRGRGTYEEALASILQPTLVIGIETDGLFTISEQYELSEKIMSSEILIIHSFEGHDGFLLEFEQMNKHLSSFIRRHTPELVSGPTEPVDMEASKSKNSLFGEVEGPDALLW